MDKINLDDLKVYAKADPDGMLERIKEMPMQCRQAWQAAMGLPLPSGYKDINKVVILIPPHPRCGNQSRE